MKGKMVGNSGGRGLVFLVIFRGNIAYLRCMCSLLTRVVLLPKTNRIESEIGSPFCSGSRLSKSSVVLAYSVAEKEERQRQFMTQ